LIIDHIITTRTRTIDIIMETQQHEMKLGKACWRLNSSPAAVPDPEPPNGRKNRSMAPRFRAEKIESAFW